MRNYVIVLISSILLVFTLSKCKNSPTNEPPEPPEKYDLTINISPNDAGSVSPGGGTYDKDESVTLNATSNNGWQFDNWSGSGISSTENPYEIIMDRDRTITATFSNEPQPEAFTLEIELTDGVYNKKITLVSDDNGTAQTGLDGKDLEGPPVAPPNVFFTGVVNDGMNLFKDVRPTDDRLVWELRLNRASGETMSLENWTISESLEGTLMLVNNPDDSTPDIEIDMQSTVSYSISDPSITRLFVVYKQPEPAKMITNIDDQRFNEMINVKPDPSKEKSLKDKTGIGNEKNIKQNNR